MVVSVYKHRKLNPTVLVREGLHHDKLVPLLLTPGNVPVYQILLGNLEKHKPLVKKSVRE